MIVIVSEIWGFKRVEPVVPPRPPRFYEEMYPVPDPMASHEEWLQWEHLDLAEMSIAEVQLEQDRLRDRLTHDRHPRPWLLRRWEAIQSRLANVQR